MTGRLFLVVGPSGSGKDTLLDAAKKHFADSKKVYFPKRYITRDQDAGGEDHLSLDENRFELLRLQARFALYWEAHNLKYGISHVIDDYLGKGQNVVVNVSRSILDYARDHYENLCVISIVVSPEELERRLCARGRETASDIAHRLERAQAFRVSGPDVIQIDNSGDLDASIVRFIDVLCDKATLQQSA